MRGLFVLVWLGAGLWGARFLAVEELAGRIAGLQAQIFSLEGALVDAEARVEGLQARALNQSSGPFPGLQEENSTEAALVLEGIVIGAAQSRALELQSFRTVETIGELNGAGVGFEIEARGGYGDLVAFLNDLENGEPVIGSRALWIRAGGSFAESEVETPVQLRGLFWTVVELPAREGE